MTATRGLAAAGLSLLLASVLACQPTTPPTPGSPTTTPAAPSPAAVPRETPAPPPAVGSARATVLAAANQRFDAGDLRGASDLYRRVLDTPRAPDEPAAVSAAIEGLSRFRAALVFASLGDDEQARQQVEELQRRDPSGPFTSLAAQLLLQYGHTGNATTACAAAVNPLPAVATEALATLDRAGAPLPAERLCRGTR